ncbi:hypothetical protein AVO42_08355 [Thiomicrospira sp. XS5]|nr:hypothetical protein AVO42_08355 [Thiomicrospira sp. XS5]
MLEAVLMKQARNTLLVGILVSPMLAHADVHPGKTLHDDANCMKCHADLGYNQPNLTKMKPENYVDLQKAVAYCDSNLNVGWFDDEREEVVDYLNETYYHFPK